MFRFGAGVCFILMFIMFIAIRGGAESANSASAVDISAAPAVNTAKKTSGNKQACAACHADKLGRRVLGQGDGKPPLWDPLALSRATVVPNQAIRSLPPSASPNASGNAGQKTKSLSGPLISEATALDTHTSDSMGDHPVDITYDAALVSKSGMLAMPVKNPDPTSSLRTGLFTPTGVFLPLFGGKLQCETCHDFHNESLAPLHLRDNSYPDVLCQTCHTY